MKTERELDCVQQYNIVVAHDTGHIPVCHVLRKTRQADFLQEDEALTVAQHADEVVLTKTSLRPTSSFEYISSLHVFVG